MARKVKFDFNPLEGHQIPRGVDKDELLEDIAGLVLEEMLLMINSGKSPVTGKAFKKLNDDYKKSKVEQGGSGKPDLELEGDLLSMLSVEKLKGNKLRITVDDSQQGKADGHNNFSGKSKLPRRPFIPDADRNESLTTKIKSSVDELIETFISEEGQLAGDLDG